MNKYKVTKEFVISYPKMYIFRLGDMIEAQEEEVKNSWNWGKSKKRVVFVNKSSKLVFPDEGFFINNRDYFEQVND